MLAPLPPFSDTACPPSTEEIEVHDLASLPRARVDDWLTLFDAQPTPGFEHHPDWLAAIDTHLLGGSLRVVMAHDETGPLALLPLGSDARAREAMCPRHAHLALSDIVLHPRLPAKDTPNLIGRLIDAASPKAEVWRIADLPASSVLGRALSDGIDTSTAAPPSLWSHRESRRSARFALAGETRFPPGKLRRNLARLRRRLAEKGTLRHESVTGGDALAAAFTHFTALEASGWKGEEGSGTAIAGDAALLGFYGALLTPRHSGLTPRIELLWLDERCIAAQYGLVTGRCLSLLKIAYDEDHAACAPGSLLLESTMSAAAAEGLDTLSLVTSPAWASRWHPREQPLWHVARYAPGIGGQRRRIADQCREKLRGSLDELAGKHARRTPRRIH